MDHRVRYMASASPKILGSCQAVGPFVTAVLPQRQVPNLGSIDGEMSCVRYARAHLIRWFELREVKDFTE